MSSMLNTTTKISLNYTTFESFVTGLKMFYDLIGCPIPTCFCPWLPCLPIGWLILVATKELQLNPSNVEFPLPSNQAHLEWQIRALSLTGTFWTHQNYIWAFRSLLSGSPQKSYLSDIWFLSSFPHRFCSISVWSHLNLCMFRKPPTEVLNHICNHQQAQMTSGNAAAIWAYVRRKAVWIVFSKFRCGGKSKESLLWPPGAEVKTEKETNSWRELEHGLICSVQLCVGRW